jgi:hypothetical protein
MKQYKVLSISLTTHKGLKFKEGDIVPEIKLHPDHIAGLISSKAIELITKEKPAKDEKI